MKKIVFRLILSFVIVIAVGASAVTATQAFLSDSVSLTTNTFSTGTADLQVATSPVTDYGDTKTGFTNTSLLPGQTVSFPFRLKNNSADTDFSVQVQAVLSGTNTLPANKISLTFTAINSSGDPVGTPVTDTLDHFATIKDLGNPLIQDGQLQRYKMDVKIDESITAPNSSVSFDLNFTGTQVLPTPTPTVTP